MKLIAYAFIIYLTIYSILHCRLTIGSSAVGKLCPKGCTAIAAPGFSLIWGPVSDLGAIAKEYGWTSTLWLYTVNMKHQAIIIEYVSCITAIN